MILITGASRGIGAYLFKKFSDKGEIVYGTYNSTYPESTRHEYYYKLNIVNYSEVENMISNIRDNIGYLNLINCAGNNYNSFAHKADLSKWIDVINVNLIGTFNMIRATLPVMRDQNYGRIINCSSVVAQTGVPGTSAYATAKAGLWGMVKSIAVENAKKGITINNLNLGYYDIGMISEVPESFQKLLKEKIPTGKFGNPENIWNAVNFIIKNEYINGSSIDINGALF